MQYFLLIALILIVLWILFYFRHFTHRFWSFFWIVVILFFVISFLYVFQGQSIDFKTSVGLKTAFKVYTGWFLGSFENVKQITGQVIQMDWRSNSTA